MTATKTAQLRDPLSLPTRVAELPWYVDLLEVLAATERDREAVANRMRELQTETEERRRHGQPVTREEGMAFREITNGIRRHDALIREHTKVLRSSLVEHYDEVDDILREQLAGAIAEARAVNDELGGRLAEAVTAYNDALAGERVVRDQFIRMYRGAQLPAGTALPVALPGLVSSPIELIERVGIGDGLNVAG